MRVTDWKQAMNVISNVQTVLSEVGRWGFNATMIVTLRYTLTNK